MKEINKHESKYIHIRKDIIGAIFKATGTLIISGWLCWSFLNWFAKIIPAPFDFYESVLLNSGATISTAVLLLCLIATPIILSIYVLLGGLAD